MKCAEELPKFVSKKHSSTSCSVASKSVLATPRPSVPFPPLGNRAHATYFRKAFVSCSISSFASRSAVLMSLPLCSTSLNAVLIRMTGRVA